jgi:hypothetical protein
LMDDGEWGGMGLRSWTNRTNAWASNVSTEPLRAWAVTGSYEGQGQEEHRIVRVGTQHRGGEYLTHGKKIKLLRSSET